MTHQAFRKTALSEESGLAHRVPAIGRKTLAEPTGAHVAQQPGPVMIAVIEGFGDQIGRHAPFPEFGTNAEGAVALAHPLGHVLLGKALVAEQSALFEIVEHRAKGILLMPLGRQFTFEFGATVFASGQQAYRRSLQFGRGRLVGIAAQASTSSGASDAVSSPDGMGRAAMRTWVSISAAMSGFSLRKVRTFSLPCPMRSPL